MFIRGDKVMIQHCKKGKMRGTLECNGPSYISTRVFQLVRLIIIFDLKKKREYYYVLVHIICTFIIS